MLVRLFAFGIFPTAVLFGGCVAYQLKTGHASPMDNAAVAKVTPGVALTDVLTWLGPPDYIIDGTRRIVDASGGPPRTITAPDGTVILVYGNTSSETTFVGGGAVPGARSRSSHMVADLFVVVSKKDKRVLETARSVSVR